MTTYNRRDMPHPTLKPGGADYDPKISFGAEPAAIRRSAQTGEITIALKYGLNSTVLRNLIEDGRAHYHTLTECVATKLRESHQSQEDTHMVLLNADQYRGQVLIRPFIIASEKIPAVNNGDWAPWIRDMLPNGTPVPKGAILAVGVEKSFETDETSELESYVEIAPSQTVEQGRFKIDLSGQRIVIYIHPEDKPDIDRVRSDEDTRSALFPSMYQRAIEEAIKKHGKEEHTGKSWANRISVKLAEHDLETGDPDILDANSLDYAQQLLENPLTRITKLTPGHEESEE